MDCAVKYGVATKEEISTELALRGGRFPRAYILDERLLRTLHFYGVRSCPGCGRDFVVDQTVLKSGANSRQYCVSCFVGGNHATKAEVDLAIQAARLREKEAAPRTRYPNPARELKRLKAKRVRARVSLERLQERKKKLDSARSSLEREILSGQSRFADLEKRVQALEQEFATPVPSLMPAPAPQVAWSERAVLLNQRS